MPKASSKPTKKSESKPKRRPSVRETRLFVKEECELMPFIISKMGGMSRNSVKLLLARRVVQVNGRIEALYSFGLKYGDIVTIISGEAKRELSHPKLKVVFEDDELLVVDKQVGLLTVPTIANSREVTAFSILKTYVKQGNVRNGIYVVHRLDRETSGLLVFAKNKTLQEYMRENWRQIVTKRTYVAVVEGQVPKANSTITTWFTENPKTTRVYSSPIDNGGKIAITHYKRVKYNETHSLLELNLETGRTNQIRVHMEAIGHPVVGDRKYGRGATPILDRLALHARVLEFIHPGTQEKLHFETPVPRPFLKLFHEKTERASETPLTP